MKHNNNAAQIFARICGMVIAFAITLLILLIIFAGIKSLWCMLF